MNNIISVLNVRDEIMDKNDVIKLSKNFIKKVKLSL